MVLKDQNFTDKLYGPCVLAIWLMDYEPDPLSNGPWCVMYVGSSVRMRPVSVSSRHSGPSEEVPMKCWFRLDRDYVERDPIGKGMP